MEQHERRNPAADDDDRIAGEFQIEEFRSSGELRAAMSQTQWRTIGMEVNNNNNNDDDEEDESDDESVGSNTDVCQTALNSVDNKSLKSVVSWIQCDRPECGKWRKVEDVSGLSDRSWNCTMNPDESRNDCYFSQEEYSDEDEEIVEDEEESVYTKYIPGEIVLGKLAGFPWWPCIVENDPDFESFFYIDRKDGGSVIISFHVTFFGKGASRAWVTEDMLQDFTGRETAEDVEKLHPCKRSYTKDLAAAITDAASALKLPVQRRAAKFGFLRRYTGSKLADKHKPASSSRKKTAKKTVTKSKQTGRRNRKSSKSSDEDDDDNKDRKNRQTKNTKKPIPVKCSSRGRKLSTRDTSDEAEEKKNNKKSKETKNSRNTKKSGNSKNTLSNRARNHNARLRRELNESGNSSGEEDDEESSAEEEEEEEVQSDTDERLCQRTYEEDDTSLRSVPSYLAATIKRLGKRAAAGETVSFIPMVKKIPP